MFGKVREQRYGRARRNFRAVKYSLSYYNDRHMPLYICPNPQNEQHQDQTVTKLWTLEDHDVSL